MDTIWRKQHHPILVLCLCLLLLSQLFLPASATGSEKTLRVAYVGYPGFAAVGQDGTMQGYCVEFLDHIGVHAKLKFEWVQASWEDSLELLKNQQLDLVCLANYTPQRELEYEYCPHHFGTMQQLLYARPDDTIFYYNDFSSFHGKRIGVLRASKDVENLAAYARQNGFSYTEVLFKTDEEMLAALQSGSIDLLATENLLQYNQLKLVGDYGTEPYYLISYRGNDFMSSIGEAIGKILEENPNYREELLHKYCGDSAYYRTLRLTRDEHDYIARAGEIRVGLPPDDFPLSGLNQKSGKPEGINRDILEKLSQISGLKLVPKPLPPGKDPLDALRQGEIDLAMGLTESSILNHDDTFVLTRPYLSSRLTATMRKGEVYDPSKAYTVALSRSCSSLQLFILQNYPHYRTLLLDSTADCAEAVLDGRADLMVQNVFVVNYLLQMPRYETLSMVPASFSPQNLQFAGRAGEDKALFLLLGKSLSLLGEDTMDDMVVSSTAGKPYRLTIPDVLYQYRFPLAAMALMLSALTAMLMLILFLRRRNEKQIRAKNSELLAAAEQAEQASAAKSEFLSRMSHDIRTPLNGIIGITHLAAEQNNPPQMVDYLNKIETSSQFLLGLVNDILDMTKAESGKIELHPQPYPLSLFQTYMEAVIRPLCQEKHQTLILETDSLTDGIPLLDQLRVNQIFFNLLSNAVKYTPEGGTITCRIHAESDSSQRMHLHGLISDTGIGMSEGFQRELFEPFTQEGRNDSAENRGSGLGLAITKKLLDLMGGQISLQSKPGEGSTFEVTICAPCIPFAEWESSAHPQPLSSESDLRLQGKHILLCEDHPLNQEIAKTLLQGKGMVIDLAENGAIALQKFQSSPPHFYDAILMDIRMPVMNGQKAAQAIRSLPRSDAKSTPILAMTADAFEEDIQKCLACGMDGHIAKPIDPKTLYASLEQCFRSAEQ